jgi:hypothetical protein
MATGDVEQAFLWLIGRHGYFSPADRPRQSVTVPGASFQCGRRSGLLRLTANAVIPPQLHFEIGPWSSAWGAERMATNLNEFESALICALVATAMLFGAAYVGAL